MLSSFPYENKFLPVAHFAQQLSQLSYDFNRALANKAAASNGRASPPMPCPHAWQSCLATKVVTLKVAKIRQPQPVWLKSICKVFLLNSPLDHAPFFALSNSLIVDLGIVKEDKTLKHS